MIRERADWCISRQRRWGLPIPVFYCKDCGKPVCTDETIAAVSELFDEGGLQRLVRQGRRGASCPRASPAPTAAASRLRQGDRHSGRLVRLRLHPLRLHEARSRASGLPTMYLEGAGPVPRLVPVLPADRRGRSGPRRTLQGVRHPRLDRGRRGQGHAQVPGQRHGPRRDLSTSTAPTSLRLWAGFCRLPRGRPLLRRDLQAAEPELPEVPQHRPVLPGQPGRLRPRPSGGARATCWSWTSWAVTRLNDLIDKVLPQATTTTSSMWCPTPSTTSAWWSCAQLLSGHHQGPPVLRRDRRPGPPQRPDAPCS